MAIPAGGVEPDVVVAPVTELLLFEVTAQTGAEKTLVMTAVRGRERCARRRPVGVRRGGYRRHGAKTPGSENGDRQIGGIGRTLMVRGPDSLVGEWGTFEREKRKFLSLISRGSDVS